MKLPKSTFFVWLMFSLFIVLFDQATKYYLVTTIPLHQGVELGAFFNLVHAQNYGVAFSFLDIPGGWQRWIFFGISLIVSLIIGVWMYREKSNAFLLMIGLSLILGGALGNLIDRARLGYVIDFLDLHVGSWHWPAFNVADSAVCIGALLLILHFYSREKHT